MKKSKGWIVGILGAVLLGAACGRTREDGFSKQEEVLPTRTKSFTIGGIKVSAEDGLYERKTGTELTDAAQELLKEKYGEEFCCEQYLYYEEFSLLVDLSAYPKGHPELSFSLDVQSQDGAPKLQWDKYYNERYRDEIEEYIYPAVECCGVAREEFFADVYDMVTTPQITSETFYQKSLAVYLSVPEERMEEIHAQMPEMIPQIYDQIRSEEGFWVYVCREGMQSVKEFAYDRILRGYRVEYCAEDPSQTEERIGLLDIHYDLRPGKETGSWTIPVKGETAAGDLREGDEENESFIIYMKEPKEEDILRDEDSGISYVKNQVLVGCLLGTPREIMEVLAEELDADIVGYIDLTCDYQLEFREDRSYGELKQMTEILEGYPFVENATLNYIIEHEPN